MALTDEPPTLVLGDEDLWRIHQILDDQVLRDPQARRFGFVKVRLISRTHAA